METTESHYRDHRRRSPGHGGIGRCKLPRSVPVGRAQRSYSGTKCRLLGKGASSGSQPGIVGTDSKGGYDAVTRHEGANLGISNARAAIQGHQMKECIQQAGTRLIWLSGEWNISDPLTKKSPDCISAKRARQQGKSAVQTMRQVLKPSTAKKILDRCEFLGIRGSACGVCLGWL